jgi:hypothetical protein
MNLLVQQQLQVTCRIPRYWHLQLHSVLSNVRNTSPGIQTVTKSLIPSGAEGPPGKRFRQRFILKSWKPQRKNSFYLSITLRRKQTQTKASRGLEKLGETWPSETLDYQANQAFSYLIINPFDNQTRGRL